jgi:hypothetical protein
VRYRLLRGSTVRLTLRALVNYRDSHGETRADGWAMEITPTANGVRVVAFAGAAPVLLQASGVASLRSEPAHVWYRGFALVREQERGLPWVEDHLHAATFTATLEAGEAVTIVVSTEHPASLDGDAAWGRRRLWDEERLLAWRKTRPWAAGAPPWIARLVLAADQFVARRPRPEEPGGMTVIAGYPWFGDWVATRWSAFPDSPCRPGARTSAASSSGPSPPWSTAECFRTGFRRAAKLRSTTRSTRRSGTSTRSATITRRRGTTDG